MPIALRQDRSIEGCLNGLMFATVRHVYGDDQMYVRSSRASTKWRPCCDRCTSCRVDIGR
eukprot:3622106-Lingulodinium_polyedra.AAC.1